MSFVLRPEFEFFFRFWSLLEDSGLFWWNGALHWRGEYHDLCRFWLWFYFLPRNSYKSRTYQPRTEIFFQILWKHKRIPKNDHHNCPIDLEHTSQIVVNRYKFWDLYAATLITLNHMTDGDTMSNQYPQITTHQPRTDVYLLFCLLRPMKRERERENDGALGLHSSKKKLPTRWTRERNSSYGWGLRSWMKFGNRGQGMEVHHLWWNLVVLKCSLMFYCSICIVQWCNVFGVFWNFTVVVLFFSDDFELETKLHQKVLWSNNIPLGSRSATFLCTFQNLRLL